MRRLRLVAATVALALPAVGLVLASPASADDVYWVPASGRFALHGHGYGHGHGMSQHGAQGAALRGKTWREIVGFYYPGTAVGDNSGLVRVLVTADTGSDVVVAPATRLTVTDLTDASRWRLPQRQGRDRWRLTPSAADPTRTAVQYRDGRGWHRWRVPGRTTLRGDGQFSARGPLTLVLPSGTVRQYRGDLRAASPSPGSSARDTVNVVPMDAYVRGVVPYEMPASWAQQALRAQAVAARTYASYLQRQRASSYYQLCDTTACQVYGGRTAEQTSTNRAVANTAGKILTAGGRPAFTQFSASSGGWTSAGGLPYLPARKDPFDDWSGNTVHDWATTLDARRLEATYPGIGQLQRIRVTRREGHGQWGGRIVEAVLVGNAGQRTVSGDTLRFTYGLRSTWFAAEATPIVRAWRHQRAARKAIGRPVARESAVRNRGGLAGTQQRFVRGRMTWTDRTGAHPLSGAILGRWVKDGGVRSRAGYPVERATATSAGDGRKQGFQRGAYFSSSLGAHHLFGPILKAYRKRNQAAGPLGYPKTKVYDIGKGRRARFQHGRITWIRETGRVRVEVD